jgi:hypothetical protein
MSREFQKTPFYKVEIGDSSGQNLIPLPYQIHRLIEKIEIKELFIEGGCTGGQFTITFNEGSREPFPTNSDADTSAVYPLNASGSGHLSNKVGMLADINYTQEGGGANLTSILPSASGIINNVGSVLSSPGAVANLAGSVLEAASGTSPKLITLDDKTTSTQPIKYLFQQRNQIKITWGYVEDLENRRSVRGLIAGVDYDYPENDNPKVIITSVETSMIFDQVSSIFGKNFSNKVPKGATNTGKITVAYEDLDLKAVIEKFCSDANMAEPMVSDEYAEIKLDKHAIRTIPAGMSPQQFFSEMAKKYDAYFKVFVDPATGKDTMVFLSKKEFLSTLILDDKKLLTYKAPGSFVKSVKLKAEYNAMTGNAQGGVGDDGKAVTVASNSSVAVGIVDAQADLVDANPTGNNPVQAAKGGVKALNSPFAVGNHGYNPEINDVNTVSRQVYAKANCQLSNIIMVSLSTIGFAKFRPGPWFVGGLGQRYSGTYYFREVMHTLDATGYTCKLEGSNQSDYGGVGKPSDGVAKTQAGTPEVSVGLTQPTSPSALLDAAASAATGGTASDKYNKSQEAQ